MVTSLKRTECDIVAVSASDIFDSASNYAGNIFSTTFLKNQSFLFQSKK